MFRQSRHRALPVATPANAEDIARRKTTSPAAQVEVRNMVGRAESIHQPANKDPGIRNKPSSRGRIG